MTDPRLVHQFVVLLWLPVFLLWGISARHSKPTVDSKSEGRSQVAVWFVWLAWFLMFSHGLRRPPLSLRFISVSDSSTALGLGLTLVGLAFAVWARFSIGRNWSGLIELKKEHQLIRSGPYAIVRHPIYSGFMLATLGTAIAFGEWSALLAFGLIVVAWGYKATLEERALTEKFGTEYEDYRRRVKRLVPFVW
jgi:protein-S-isoprenylcysteine O-methyltransferase Ste14